MHRQINSLHRTWLRRWWQPNAGALASFAGLTPVVVVTGGSEGIGLALAENFARARHRLLLVARDQERLAGAAARLRAAYAVDIDVLSLDLSEADGADVIARFLAERGAYADVLVNNAGLGLSGDFVAQDPAAIAQLVDVNVRALTRLTRHFLPDMKARGRGGILNLASIGSYGPGPNQAIYYASKAYVLSLTEAIAHENAGHGVRICAIAPGPVRTRFHKKMGAENALYRWITPPMPPELVARVSYWGFMMGMRVVWPGVITPFAALAMRLLPHRILNVIVATLLKPHGR